MICKMGTVYAFLQIPVLKWFGWTGYVFPSKILDEVSSLDSTNSLRCGAQGDICIKLFFLITCVGTIFMFCQFRFHMMCAQSCPTLCDSTDCSPPGSSVRGFFQVRILEWVDISYSRGSSWARGWVSSQPNNPSVLSLLCWQVDSLPLCHTHSIQRCQCHFWRKVDDYFGHKVNSYIVFSLRHPNQLPSGHKL